MLIVGLTGSMGMGKSTAAAQFRARGIAVFDADAEVHRLYDGPIASKIEAAFPGTTLKGSVDRFKLSAVLLKSPERLSDLEKIVHPAVREAERQFLTNQKKQGAKIAVLEIPLLFETGADKFVDVTIVVSAPSAIQRSRVLARPGMTEEKFRRLLQRQLPDSKKREKADFIVETGGLVSACHEQVDAIIDKIESRTGEAFGRHWSS